MTLKSFTSKHRREAETLLRNGGRPKDVAAQFGVSLSTIYNLRREAGGGRGRASNVVTLRLSDEELAALRKYALDGGFDGKSAALRSLIRAATGYLELRREEFLDLERLNAELKSQGVNINQMARALNKSALFGGASLSRGDKEELLALRNSLGELRVFLKSALKEVRQNGRSALHKATKI